MGETTGDSRVIVAESLSRSFGSINAVNEVSFHVDRGEVVGLLGHNGAGKTTTIRILNGLFMPSGGSSRVLGLDPAIDGARVRALTGVLTETPSLDERLTAEQNLSFSARLFGLRGKAARRRVDELLQLFGLADRARDRTATFSRGMKQRLALSRALLHDPDILFLDEPTTALDPVAARDVHELVRGSAGAKRTVVISTHNLLEAQRLCDRVLILRDGRLVAQGTPRDLVRRLGSTSVALEVDPAQLSHAREVAERAGYQVRELADDTLEVDDVARDRIPSVVAALTREGISLYRVTPAEPTLEDVYFSLYEAGA